MDDTDIYPKIICDECLRELLIVAKFKEKVKLTENTLSQLIVSDEKISNSDGMIEETEESQADDYPLLKEETSADDDGEDVTGSYEEVEFLELHGQNDSVQFATDKCDDDEFVDEIIEECSVDESYILDTIGDVHLNQSTGTTVKVSSDRSQLKSDLIFPQFCRNHHRNG